MEHFFRRVPGWATFAQLYIDRVVAAPELPAVSHFVEVGSWLGRSAALMAVEIANSGKAIRFDCVDTWSDGGPDLVHKVAGMKKPIYEIFLANVAPVRELLNPVRMPSVDAAALYEDGSLDFVMIDGSHVYEDVAADIAAWRPKVKAGGVLGFDDMNWSGVKRAVAEALDPARLEMHYGPPRPGKGRCAWASYTC